MRQNSLLLAVLAALCIALLVQASPTRGGTSSSRPPSRSPSRPASPARPPSKPVGKPTKPPKTKPHPAAPPAHGSGPSTSSSGQQTAASRTELLTTKAKCNTHTTCEECAGASKKVKVQLPGEGTRKGSKVDARCAWQQATSSPQGKCIGIEVPTRPLSPSLHLTTNENQCQALEQAVNAHLEQLLKEKQKARAVQLWNAMKSHVLGTAQSQNADSGTHVASGWLSKHKTDTLTVEKATQLAQSTETPAKTLWLDNVNDPEKYPGPYYTTQDVATMCETALLALIETVHEEALERGSTGSTHSSSQHSSTGSTHSAADDTIKIPVQKRAFSVKSPRTEKNVCITIAPQKSDADYSCFPSNTKVTTTPVGKECTKFRGN